MKHILLLLLLSSLVSSGERTFRTLFLNGPQRSLSNYYIFDGESSIEAEFPRLSFSPVYKLKLESRKIWLLKHPISDAKMIPKGSPVVRVPAGMKDFYLILTRNKKNKILPLKMQIVNAGKHKLARGEMIWYNLTKKPVEGKVGGHVLKLPAKKSAIVKEPRRGKGNFVVELYFKIPGDERTHPLTEGNWRHDPRCRNLVFVMNEKRRRAPKIQAFADYRRPQKKRN